MVILRGGQPGIVGLDWTKTKQPQSVARAWNGPTAQSLPCPSAELVTWVCGSVAGSLASGPDRVARNEMVDARARVLCSPSLREGPRLSEDDDC